MSEWERLPEEHEIVYRTADGELTWLETQRLYDVRESPEIREQERMEAAAQLVWTERYWKFLRWLFDHGHFADDQIEPSGDSRCDLR